jgi:crotonobetainyl-CoA:carnitine CoA-transferase CaiB-like acyl-CoA transferase
MAGALATMILADAGAEVIKIEPPSGDPFWSLPAYRQWQRGKHRRCLDLKDPAGRAAVYALVETADVSLMSYRPGVAERLGVDYPTLAARNPGLVYAAITPFGEGGPYAGYPGYEGIVAAKAGRMQQLAGQVQRAGPVYSAVPVASYGAAQLVLQGILAALHARRRTGRGQRVDTSLLRGLTPYDLVNWLTIQINPNDTTGTAMDRTAVALIYKAVYLPGRTKDGRWIQFANNAPHLFLNFIRLMGLEHLYADERFSSMPNIPNPADQDALRDMLLERLAEKTLDEWMAIFLADPDNACEPFLTTQEGMDHPQIRYNGDVIALDDPLVGPTEQLGPLAKLEHTPLVPQGPAPVPLDGTSEAYTWSQPAPPVTLSVPDSRGAVRAALDDLLVLDFSTWIAGGFTSTPLADLGARVIKVEPITGDPFRGFGRGEGVAKMSAGKLGLAVDLKKPEGRAIVHQLIERADILIHNFRPGVPEKLGIDYATARQLNPRLLYHYAGAYGSTGPYAYRPAFHPIASAITGNALHQAGRGCPPPAEAKLTLPEVVEYSRQLGCANEGNPDPTSALAAATAILLSLYARDAGWVEGQRSETTMICANAYAMSEDWLRYAGKPPRREPDAELYGLHALYRLYPAAGDSWVFLACVQEKEWQALVAALGRPAWATDPRFATPAERLVHEAELAERLGEVFCTREAAVWEQLLIPAGVPCVRADGPHLSQFLIYEAWCRADGVAIPVEHRRFGRIWRHGPVAKLSATPGAPGPGCELGEHTREILAELGYSEAEMQALRDKRVVVWPA